MELNDAYLLAPGFAPHNSTNTQFSQASVYPTQPKPNQTNQTTGATMYLEIKHFVAFSVLLGGSVVTAEGLHGVEVGKEVSGIVMF